MDKEKELEILLAGEEMDVNGTHVVIKKIAMLDTLRLATQLSSLVTKVMSDAEAFSTALAKVMYEGDESAPIKIAGALELLGMMGEEGIVLLQNVLMKSTNLSKEDVEALDLVDGLDVAEGVYRVNKVFFVKSGNKLLDKLKKALPAEEPEQKKKKSASTK